MPMAARPDGVEINWRATGEGPLVVLGAYWSMHPSAFARLIEELATDHRVVTYDDRGTGESTRRGPYDLDTSAGDLAAVVEAADAGPAVVVCSADAANRGVRILATRSELIQAIVCVGGVPLGRRAFSDSDALVASEVVVDALLHQVETDYRGALRSILTATNAQMSEEERRERVNSQIEHCPQEAAVGRLAAWGRDDPVELAKAAGDRVWIATSERLGGGWFPAGAELARRVGGVLPEANVVEIEDGFVSRPDETAALVRRARAAAARALDSAE